MLSHFSLKYIIVYILYFLLFFFFLLYNTSWLSSFLCVIITIIIIIQNKIFINFFKGNKLDCNIATFVSYDLMIEFTVKTKSSGNWALNVLYKIYNKIIHSIHTISHLQFFFGFIYSYCEFSIFFLCSFGWFHFIQLRFWVIFLCQPSAALKAFISIFARMINDNRAFAAEYIYHHSITNKICFCLENCCDGRFRTLLRAIYICYLYIMYIYFSLFFRFLFRFNTKINVLQCSQ